MKIALVLEDFDPRRGGLEQWTWRFAAGMIRRGHEVHVLARRFRLPPVVPKGEGTCVWRSTEWRAELPVIPHLLEGAHSRLGFAEAARTRLLALAPDVIHDMGAGWHCDIFQPHGGSWAAMSRQKLLLKPAWLRPLKCRVDQRLPRYRACRALAARQYADRGQILVAVSQGVAEDFTRFHGVTPDRIRVVYNGVDTERFTPGNRALYREAVRRQLGLAEDALLALIVAHNFQLKGVPTLLRAMRRLVARAKPVHLAVVGGKRLPPWQWMAQGLGIGPSVTFLGFRDDTAPYYAAADVYVQPTLYDPCSLVALEALASGLPVITSRFNGASELMTEGVEGFVLSDPRDAEALAARLRLLFEPSLRRAMGEAARGLALRHTMDHNCDQLEAVYAEMAAARTLRNGLCVCRMRLPSPMEA